jgi:hypothetical protein
MTPSISPKSFWKRPEGKVGLIPPIALGALAIYFWGEIVPFLVNAADNTLHLVLTVIAIVAIFWILADKNFRNFIFYFYKSAMRLLTSMFVEIDPIGILKTYKSRLVEKLGEMDSALSDIKAERVTLERKMKENQSAYEHSMSLVDAAHKANDQRTLALESKQVGRLEKRLERQKAYYERIMFVVNVLTRYRQVSEDTITDMGRDIEDKELERQESRAYKKGMAAAFGILRGLPDEKEMYDMSCETLERQYSQAIGEVEHFMDITKDIISKANLEDSAATDAALAKLEAWRSKDGNVAIGKTSKASIIDSATKGLPAPAPAITGLNKPAYTKELVERGGFGASSSTGAASADYNDLFK